ncbi:MAG: glycosyltransferase [Flavobacteriaceae bacterium]|nr:glycosyltransferase [Flavobacteriaceae bacterium]
MEIFYSFVIPVYNRPEEIEELLQSLKKQTFSSPFEVVIVDDGSDLDSKSVVVAFENQLDIHYHYKNNTGPGHSRNIGMGLAKGNYYLILDSDCILPTQYLEEVDRFLKANYVDCFGGPDEAHEQFSVVQKAINYAMTSVLTTGGIRGKKKAVNKFQPRSFNMGISQKAFEATQGFGRIHPGEDPDLTIRIWDQGFETALIPDAFVYHKRRIDWKKFHTQVRKFGLVRPILNSWHPHTAKLTYWFPTMFILGLVFSIMHCFLAINCLFLSIYGIYFSILFLDAWWKNKSILIAFYAIYATLVQFWGYGIGFLTSTFWIRWYKKDPEKQFPKLFFKKQE